MNKFMMLVLLCSPTLSFAESYPAFSPLAPEYSVEKNSSIEAKNMPPIRSQDGLNICYGFSSWTLFQQFQCEETKSDCSKIDPSKSPSPLYLATGSYTNPGSGRKAGSSEAIPFNDGGNSFNALIGFQEMGGSYADSCYPFDQFVSKFKNSTAETSGAFDRLKKNYEEYHKKNQTEGKFCTDCLVKELNDDFNIKKDNVESLKASISHDTFDKFLFDIFLKDCSTTVDAPDFKVNGWPKVANQPYDATINKMKEILKTGKPFSIGACLKTKESLLDGSCKTPHDFVVSGYRKYCKKDGSCRESLKISNSWGQDWQNENNDGWVDAKTLYDYMGKDKNALTWITKK